MKHIKNETRTLNQAIGAGSLALIVFNCTVGGGIFRLPGEVYEIAGSRAPLAYLLCAAAIVLIAMVFIQVGSDEANSGGPYAYVERELGSFVGFISGFLLLLMGAFGMATVMNACVDSLFVLFPELNSHPMKVFLIVSIASVLAAANCLGVKKGTLLVKVITVIKLIPILALIIIGLIKLDFAPIHQDIRSIESPSVLRAAFLLMFAFMGVESALTPSGEIKNPKKTIPKGLILGIVAVLCVYLGLQMVSQSILGHEIILYKEAPLAFAAEKVMGSFGKSLLLMGAVFSMLGYLSSLSLGMPRVLYKMGKDSVFPHFLSKLHATYQTPNNAIIVFLIFVSAISLTGTFTSLAVVANLSALSMYILCSVAAIKKNPKQAWIPLLTIALLITLLSSIKTKEYLGTALAVLLASVIYKLRKPKVRA